MTGGVGAEVVAAGGTSRADGVTCRPLCAGMPHRDWSGRRPAHCPLSCSGVRAERVQLSDRRTGLVPHLSPLSPINVTTVIPSHISPGPSAPHSTECIPRTYTSRLGTDCGASDPLTEAPPGTLQQPPLIVFVSGTAARDTEGCRRRRLGRGPAGPADSAGDDTTHHRAGDGLSH